MVLARIKERPVQAAILQLALILHATPSPARATSYSDSDAWHHDNGKVGIEVARVKWIRVECSSPATDTSPVSPIFASYLSVLQATTTPALPLVFAAQ